MFSARAGKQGQALAGFSWPGGGVTGSRGGGGHSLQAEAGAEGF